MAARRATRGCATPYDRLDELSDLPPAEHVEVYEAVHSSLQESLAEASRQADESPRRRERTFVSRRARLDAELVRRGLARSREHAASLVAAGPGAGAGTGDREGGHAGRRR